MKYISILLMSMLSVWSMAQRPQTGAAALRPGTVAQVQKPQTLSGAVQPGTEVSANRPATQAGALRPATQAEAVRAQTTVQTLHPQTTAEVQRPQTDVQVLHPQTQADVLHPQTAEFSAANQPGLAGKSAASSSAKGGTSMSNFSPKQAKDFASAQKAAKLGGGENKLGNDTNAAEKDAANKASLLGKQNNQNLDVDPNLKRSNVAAVGSAVEKKVDKKTKK